MTIFRLKNKGFRRGALAALAVCVLTVAASQGLCVRAQAEDAATDYVAPLDMTSSYPGPFESPEFLPEAMVRRAMAAPAPDTTGMNSAAPASQWQAAAALPQTPEVGADISDDKYSK